MQGACLRKSVCVCNDCVFFCCCCRFKSSPDHEFRKFRRDEQEERETDKVRWACLGQGWAFWDDFRMSCYGSYNYFYDVYVWTVCVCSPFLWMMIIKWFLSPFASIARDGMAYWQQCNKAQKVHTHMHRVKEDEFKVDLKMLYRKLKVRSRVL